MAAFQLFLGEPRGEALVKNKERLARPDGIVNLDAEDAGKLNLALDPYVSNQVWSDRSLDELAVSLETNIAKWRQTAIDGVVRSVHRSKAESWMEPMIAARIAEDIRIGLGEELLTLTKSAQGNPGTIVYWGD